VKKLLTEVVSIWVNHKFAKVFFNVINNDVEACNSCLLNEVLHLDRSFVGLQELYHSVSIGNLLLLFLRAMKGGWGSLELTRCLALRVMSLFTLTTSSILVEEERPFVNVLFLSFRGWNTIATYFRYIINHRVLMLCKCLILGCSHSIITSMKSMRHLLIVKVLLRTIVIPHRWLQIRVHICHTLVNRSMR
jgi:hypothetical protein